jgi:hypothetical protein
MTSILRATATAIGDWESIAVPSDALTSVEVVPRLLRPGDTLELDVFYTQAKPEKLSVTAAGKIVDGSIIPDKGFDIWRLRFGIAIFGAYFAAVLINLIDLWVPVPISVLDLTHALLSGWRFPWMWLVLWLLYFASMRPVRRWLGRRAKRWRGPVSARHLEAEPKPEPNPNAIRAGA